MTPFLRCMAWAALALAPLLCVTEAVADPIASDRLMIGGGLLAAPDYEGSNKYVLSPAAGALGRLKGHNIGWHGTSLSVDLVPARENQRTKIIIAPFASLNLDRATTPRDPVIALFRKRKVELEGGAVLGISSDGVLTSPYDNLTVQLSVSHDLGTVSRSYIITPTLQYLMPLSHKALVGISASADIVGRRYANYYFGVGPKAATVSGLPPYHLSGGTKSATLGLLGAYALGKDLRKRGFALGFTASWERLLGAFADSPIVAMRGSASQFIVGTGVGYTF
ncbi:MAG: MipA/OmpV family protein [Alphaproteobacteria bacterium]|nr:MipA/OmpV family protein [Alphaproteobacteria bacterium]MDE2041818.1 MipA/OmpV family protein [Alphaproteobacteria bacterium]MDE2340917.1 MipA/OmpV family protein [Alphaproteobacteria bacterium]